MDVTSSIRCKALISSPGADVSTRESKEKCETQVLPPEIWRVIAGHLGPCDWARAAGVCKATYHLQLDPVHIKSQQCEGFSALLGEQGVKWLLRRSHFARKMELDFPRTSASRQSTARAILQHPSGFCNLTGLVIDALSTRDTENANLVAAAVTCLLGKTKKLKYLRNTVDDLPYLPYLSDVQHLQLCSAMFTTCRLLPAILSIGTLQTLDLSSSKFPQAPKIHLDLQALPNLQSLVCDFVPDSLVLPKGTVVHVTLFSLDEAQSSIWDGVSAAIKSFEVLSENDVINIEQEIPQWLLRPGNIDTLVFHLKAFGKEDHGAIHLRGAFLSAKRLGFDCLESLYIEVPAGSCQWELVNFHTKGELYLGIDRSFPLHFAAFSFKFKRLGSAALIAVAWAMGQSSTLIILEQDGERVNHFHSPCNNADSLDLNSGSYSNCRCRACSACCRLDNFEGPGLPCNMLLRRRWDSFL